LTGADPVVEPVRRPKSSGKEPPLAKSAIWCGTRGRVRGADIRSHAVTKLGPERAVRGAVVIDRQVTAFSTPTHYIVFEISP